jgi:inhibitor of KinA
VPAGSVAIADGQTAVYPLASPGGWRLIGRTDLAMFDPTAADPVRIRAGDRLRFVRL